MAFAHQKVSVPHVMHFRTCNLDFNLHAHPDMGLHDHLVFVALFPELPLALGFGFPHGFSLLILMT